MKYKAYNNNKKYINIIHLNTKISKKNSFFKRNDDDFDTSSGAPLFWLHSSGYLNIVLPLNGIGWFNGFNYEEFSSDYIQIKRWNALVISSVQEDFTVSSKQDQKDLSNLPSYRVINCYTVMC